MTPFFQREMPIPSFSFMRIFLLITLAIFSSPIINAQSQNISTNFYGDVTVLWLDEFKSPLHGVIRQDDTQGSNDASYTFLGLQKARFEIDFSIQQKNKLSLVLRPDVFNSGNTTNQRYELDTRLGQVLDPLPSLQFLDSYIIHIYPFKALSASIGVFEKLNQPIGAYDSYLQFALEPRPAAKTSGIWLRWSPDSSQESTVNVDMILYQGNDERGNFSNNQIKEPDSPNTKINYDRKNGGALSTSYQSSVNNFSYFFASYLESDYSQNIDSTRFYTQISHVINSQISNRRFTIAFDGRYLLDNLVQEANITEGMIKESSRKHWSGNISGSLEIMPNIYLLSRVQYGGIQKPLEKETLLLSPEVKKIRGYAWELGIKSGEKQGIFTQALLTEDVQSVHSDYSDQFSNNARIPDSSSRRISMTITYRLNSRL